MYKWHMLDGTAACVNRAMGIGWQSRGMECLLCSLDLYINYSYSCKSVITSCYKMQICVNSPKALSQHISLVTISQHV